MILHTIPEEGDFDAVGAALRRLRDDRLALNIAPYDMRATAARVGVLEELLEDLEARRDLADLQTWTIHPGWGTAVIPVCASSSVAEAVDHVTSLPQSVRRGGVVQRPSPPPSAPGRKLMNVLSRAGWRALRFWLRYWRSVGVGTATAVVLGMPIAFGYYSVLTAPFCWRTYP